MRSEDIVGQPITASLFAEGIRAIFFCGSISESEVTQRTPLRQDFAVETNINLVLDLIFAVLTIWASRGIDQCPAKRLAVRLCSKGPQNRSINLQYIS